MNLGRIINAFAQLNPFAVKVLVENNQPFAYRNVFGLKVSAGPTAGQRAVGDYYLGAEAKPKKITTTMVGSPLGFVNSRDGDLLNILLAPPPPPKASPVLRVINPTVTSSMSEKDAGKASKQKNPAFSPANVHVAFARSLKSRFIENID